MIYYVLLEFVNYRIQSSHSISMPRLPHGHFLTQSSMKSWWKGIKSSDLPVKLELHMTWLWDDPVIKHRNGMEWEIPKHPQTKWRFRYVWGLSHCHLWWQGIITVFWLPQVSAASKQSQADASRRRVFSQFMFRYHPCRRQPRGLRAAALGPSLISFAGHDEGKWLHVLATL